MSGALRRRFYVHEIEHDGDVDGSVEDLQRAGCTGIEVVETNFEGEWMLVSCAFPSDVTDLNQLQAKLLFACVC